MLNCTFWWKIYCKIVLRVRYNIALYFNIEFTLCCFRDGDAIVLQRPRKRRIGFTNDRHSMTSTSFGAKFKLNVSIVKKGNIKQVENKILDILNKFWTKKLPNWRKIREHLLYCHNQGLINDEEFLFCTTCIRPKVLTCHIGNTANLI